MHTQMNALLRYRWDPFWLRRRWEKWSKQPFWSSSGAQTWSRPVCITTATSRCSTHRYACLHHGRSFGRIWTHFSNCCIVWAAARAELVQHRVSCCSGLAFGCLIITRDDIVMKEMWGAIVCICFHARPCVIRYLGALQAFWMYIVTHMSMFKSNQGAVHEAHSTSVCSCV